MFLSRLVVLNSGAIEEFELRVERRPDGSHYPIVLVGPNGSGKTGILSVVVDAIYEIAALHFQDVAPPRAIGHSFFRVIGGRTVRAGATMELIYARFEGGERPIEFVARSEADLNPTVMENLRAKGIPPILLRGPEPKQVSQNTEFVINDLRQNAYIYFPVGRHEIPYWSNSTLVERDPPISFRRPYKEKLGKPLIVVSTREELKSWICDVLLDVVIDSGTIINSNNIDELKNLAQASYVTMPALLYLNKILSIVVDRDDARVVRTNRVHGDGRIAVAYGANIGLPSLDSLSAGQSALFGIFASILMHADAVPMMRHANTIEGIVIIDEVDQHLHIDMQKSALPKLMALFPRVQFIVTSHSPFVPLALDAEFGAEGYYLLKTPEGSRIDAERFSEFEEAVRVVRNTDTFERLLGERMGSGRPSVICEGQTDPAYLKAAAELLGFSDLTGFFEFDWVGEAGELGARGGGRGGLDAGLKFLRHNPQFVSARTVLLYDIDAKKADTDFGELFVRSIIRNGANSLRTGGIENLLPLSVFEDRFFSEDRFKSGDDEAVARRLDKAALCTFLCNEKRLASDFEAFRPTLEALQGLIRR